MSEGPFPESPDSPDQPGPIGPEQFFAGMLDQIRSQDHRVQERALMEVVGLMLKVKQDHRDSVLFRVHQGPVLTAEAEELSDVAAFDRLFHLLDLGVERLRARNVSWTVKRGDP